MVEGEDLNKLILVSCMAGSILNEHVVAEYKAGKAASLNFLIGGVMRLSERRADFGMVTEIMKKIIGLQTA